MTGQRTGSERLSEDRVAAPPGRRLCEVAENRASGGYRIFSALDGLGPEPRAADSVNGAGPTA